MKNNWKKTLVIIYGLPGEGKSTLARKLAGGCRCDPEDVILENDMFFTDRYGHYEYDQSLAAAAGWWCYGETFRRLYIGYETIFVANTFVRADMIAGYINEAAKHEIRVFLIRANSKIGKEKAWERNVHRVPQEIMENMARNLATSHTQEFYEMAEAAMEGNFRHIDWESLDESQKNAIVREIQKMTKGTKMTKNKLDEMIENAKTPEMKKLYQQAKDFGLVIKNGDESRAPAVPFEHTKTPDPFPKHGTWIPEDQRHNIQMIPNKE